MKKVINTPHAPAPIGPYNQAIQINDTLYVSGQIAINPETGAFDMPDIATETKRVMENLQAILVAAGGNFDNVVMTTIFLSDMTNFGTVNEVYGTYFTKDFPARATVAVKTLPKNVNVEISVVAVL